MPKHARLVPAVALALVLLCSVAAMDPASGGTTLGTIRVVAGLAAPVFVSSPPEDSTRLFIVEAYTGRIRIFDLAAGVLRSKPFLTVTGMVAGGEQGLLGLAFHPNYPESGYVYVNFTRAPGGETVIRRYTVSANPDSADTSTAVTLMTIPRNEGPNHNAGWLGFGPDGYLYIPMGDKGDGSYTVSQNDSTRQGKVLRLDVDGGFPYAIPPDNPYAGDFSPKNEQWAKGLRNPWRPSFDRLTGDLYIADVGQGVMEEVDYQSASSAGGENYGWAMMEGTIITPVCPPPCDTSGLTLPVHTYTHGGSPFRCSITGGYVYRGSAIPDLLGSYFFADYCSNQIWSLRVVNGAVVEVIERTADLAPGGGLDIRSISSFGEDARGELYICDLSGGEIFRVIADPTGVDENQNTPPLAMRINGPVPNPSSTRFRLDVEGVLTSEILVRVVDSSGRSVRSFVLPGMGERRIQYFDWDARDDSGSPVGSGTYFIRLEADGHVATRSAVFIR